MRDILDRNAQAALLLLNELYTGGKDVGAVLGELSTLTRDLLLRKLPRRAVQRCCPADLTAPRWTAGQGMFPPIVFCFWPPLAKGCG